MPNRGISLLVAWAGLALAPAPALSFQEAGVLPGDRIAPGDWITIGRTVSFSSEAYGGKRQVLVYLPDDYSWSKEGYPVVYLLDGAFFFLPTAGLVDFYSSIDRMPRMIVVAVVHADRTRELSTGPSGGAAQLASFLRDELIPYVDGHFRTEPFRVLMGHSLGGLFVTHALFHAPDLFQAHIAASPALYWDGRSEVEEARQVLASTPSLKNTLYLTYSEGDGRNIRSSTDALVQVLQGQAPPDLDWSFQFLPEERHNSSAVPSVLGGLSHLFSSWSYQGEFTPQAFIAHYRQLSESLGFECRPEVGSVASRGRTLLRQGDVDGAITVFEYNARIHPEAAETHLALGSAYRAAGNLPRAIASYERALELRPGSGEISRILRELRGGGG